MNLGFVTAVIEELPSYFPLDIPRNALVVDAGAFPGDFTVAAARLVPDGKVLALEPEPHNREYLERMVHLNGMGKRVEVLPYALSDRCGSDELIKGTNSSHLVSLASKSGVTFKADTVDLDSLLNGENRPMIVKMDIEGAELLAIQGASRTLSRGAQFAIAAYHVVRGQPTHRALEGMFSSVGYKTRIGDHEHLVLFAEKD
jgi:FkbM family methyltransferase